MSVFEVLHGIQDARARVAAWGVSLDTLLWVTAIALVVFLFTLREILGWYLRLNEIRRDLREIKAQLATLVPRAAVIEPPTAAAAPASEAAVAQNLHGPERL